MNDIREKVLSWGTYALAFLLPLLWFSHRIFPYVTSKTFFLYGSVEVLFAVWVYTIVADPSYRLTKKQWLLFVPFIGYVVWMSIAGIMAVNPSLALWSSLARGTGLLTLYHALALAFITVSLIRHHGSAYIRKLLGWTIASGAIVALTIWGGDEGLNLPTAMLTRAGGGGLVGNSSLAAAYLLFIVGLSGFLLATKQTGKNVKGWIWTTIGLIIFSPLFINILGLFNGKGILGSARGATLAIVVAVAVGLCSYLALSVKLGAKVTGKLGLVGGIAVFVFLWVKLMTPGNAIHEGFVNATLGTRFIYWDIAQQAMNEHPLVGYGPENYMIAVHEHFNPQLLAKTFAFEAWTDRAHNVYFDIGATGGYPAVVLYALLMVSIIYGACVAYRRGVVTRGQAGIVIGLVVGYVFQNLFVFDGVLSLTALAVLAGVVYGATDPHSKSNSPVRILDEGAKYSFIAILAIVTAICWYNYAYLPARKAAAFGNVLGGTFSKRADLYSSLLRGSPVGNAWDVSGFAHDEYKLYAKDPESVKSNAQLLPYAKKDIAAFIDYAEKVYANNQSDYRMALSLVHLYSTQIYLGDMKYDEKIGARMVEIIDHAQVLAPTDPQVYWARAQVMAWKGDLKGVVESYRAAVAIDPTLAPAHTLLIQFLQAMGDKKGAEQALLDAQKNIPGFILAQ